MTAHDTSNRDTSPLSPYLGSLSELSARSFPTTGALVEAVLALITDKLGLRTSFLTHITPEENRNHILAAYNRQDGCGLSSGIDLPLEDTWCSVVTGSAQPTPLLINDTHTDPNFRMHRASAASPGIGSFVGVPLVLSDGQLFGTLCAIDPEAQDLTNQHADLLVVLGRIIATQIERDREAAIRAEAEAEQARLYRLAQEAIREQGALLSIASHELKNPLAALLGHAHLLQRRMVRDTNSSERDQRAVQTIITQADRLNRMLTDLLDVSRLESGQFTVERLPLDLSTLVHTVIEDMEPGLVQHTVVVEDADSPIIIEGDKERLAQVLRNLVGNAIKYSPNGGRITIAITAENMQACVSVQDEGIGIPADALPNLFQRFYRAANSAGHGINGFGIGLYVVKEIVTRHGGTIRVTSAEGEGTTFTVCLPLFTPLT